MKFDGKNHYLYNADGQICAVQWTYNSITVMTGYIYDADGNRVAKGAITTMSCDPSVNGFTTQADYVRDQAGHQLSEFVPGQSGSMAWQHTNIYANGVLIATDDQTETHFYLNDWLGTRRVQTNYAGTVEQTCSSLPFGDSETCLPSPTENLFTGKERDSESGNDYFGARYYSSSIGRWMSPDPSNWGIDFYYPQTWNHYSYVANNPLSNTDPNGLWLTPTHDKIINNAFPGLSKQQRQILQASSKEVDTHQSQDDQYMHGMDSANDTGSYDPESRSYDFIQKNEHDAKEIQAAWIASGHTGIAPAALAAFGNALHTITDEYSPSHTGFQKVHWYSYPWHWREGLAMVGAYGNSRKSAEAAARTAFFEVFGSDLGQQATHEKVTVTIIFDPNQKLPNQQ